MSAPISDTLAATAPEVQLLQSQDDLKILAVSGQAGQTMPRHRCSHAAFMRVMAGEVSLNLADQPPRRLVAGEHFLIPAMHWHDLQLVQASQLQVLMQTNAKIFFA
ncbi:MAG: AraC family ligand binding domain-containing protein [Candidatus Sericytochromatia bacterium]|nr:AraC family ligand binding domain-containing protein [Candidatus Sericytochromatia bacterium]